MTKREEFEKKVEEIIKDVISDGHNCISHKTATEISELAIEYFRTIHSKALACHCECLGMNAENSLAVCNNRSVPYSVSAYDTVMEKWGLTNKKGEPII